MEEGERGTRRHTERREGVERGRDVDGRQRKERWGRREGET